MKPQEALQRLHADFPRCLENLLEWLVVLGESPPEQGVSSIDAFRRVRADTTDQHPSPPSYVLSSLFLHRCYRRLVRVAPEDLHLATGVMLDGRFVLSDMVGLRNVQQRPAGAFAGPGEVRTGLMLMERFGLRCGGLFHSHPGVGEQSTFPSSVDVCNHQTWEKAYPLIGAIFSRDGYVRFFAAAGRPQVQVLGKRARRINECLYSLKD